MADEPTAQKGNAATDPNETGAGASPQATDAKIEAGDIVPGVTTDPIEPTKLEKAGTHFPAAATDGPLDAGSHMAQVFRNAPANPAPAKSEHTDPEEMTVELYMDAPDVKDGKIYTKVHPDMVGDYQRAGWSVVVVHTV